jgi:hypothetical protein
MLYFRSAATEEGHSKAGHGRFENMIERARIARNDTAPGYYKKAMEGPATAIKLPAGKSRLSG